MIKIITHPVHETHGTSICYDNYFQEGKFRPYLLQTAVWARIDDHDCGTKTQKTFIVIDIKGMYPPLSCLTYFGLS